MWGSGWYNFNSSGGEKVDHWRGLTDMLLAMRFYYNNAEKVKGDSKRITIVAHGSAACVLSHIVKAGTRNATFMGEPVANYYQRVILLSGSSTTCSFHDNFIPQIKLLEVRKECGHAYTEYNGRRF